MEREPGPSAAAGRPAGFVGLRVGAAVGLLSAFGGLAAVATGVALEALDERASQVLRADLDARTEAGITALAALGETQTQLEALDAAAAQAAAEGARARAVELVAVATIHLARIPDDPQAAADVVESMGVLLLDPATDRVLAGATRGATISVALPALARLARTRREAPATVEDGGILWALGPPLTGGVAVAARVEVAPPDPAAVEARTRALGRAASALVNLAAPPDPPLPPRRSWPLFAAGALLGALLGGAWAGARLGRPLASTLAAARAFVHGANDARADPARGGRDARDVAREVNALIERAERLKAQGRAARDEDVRAVVLAIEALGKGDLGTNAPAVGDALEPVAVALESSRRELLDRIAEIHRIAVEVAASAAEVAPGAKKIAAAALEELDTLRNLGAVAATANDEVKAAGEKLAAALIALGEFAQTERRVVQEVRAALRGAARRSGELARGAARIEALIGTTEAVEEAIDLLAASADGRAAEGAGPSKARVLAGVGQARAAMEAIGRELALLRDEMGETASGIDAIAAQVPETAPNLESGVGATLHDTGTTLVRIVERTTGALRSLERAARVMSDGAMQIEHGATVTADLAPRLGALVAGFSLGNAFEKDLLEKIERWRRDADAASRSPDGLTEEGRAIVRQLVESSEAARARLARLVSATEVAIDVLRG